MKSPVPKKKNNEESKHFPLIFMRCWCYLPVSLVYLGTVSLWTLISATADSHCQEPKSLQIISRMRQACTRPCSSWKPPACCSFHSHKIKAVLSEQHSLVFDWTKGEKKREEIGLGTARVCQMPAITCLCPSFHHLRTSSDEWLQWLQLLILQLRWINAILAGKKCSQTSRARPAKLSKIRRRRKSHDRITESHCSKNPPVFFMLSLTLPGNNLNPSPIWAFCSHQNKCLGDVTRQPAGQDQWSRCILMCIIIYEICSPRWGCKTHRSPHSG